MSSPLTMTMARGAVAAVTFILRGMRDGPAGAAPRAAPAGGWSGNRLEPQRHHLVGIRLEVRVAGSGEASDFRRAPVCVVAPVEHRDHRQVVDINALDLVENGVLLCGGRRLRVLAE